MAKHLFTLTNKHIGCEKTMCAAAQRRDVLETLLQVLKRQSVDAASANLPVVAADEVAAAQAPRAVLTRVRDDPPK